MAANPCALSNLSTTWHTWQLRDLALAVTRGIMDIYRRVSN